MHPQRISSSWFVGLLLGATSAAHAGPVWQCWHERVEQVACVLSQPAAVITPITVPQADTGWATTLVRPGQLPGLAGVVQHHPGAMRGQVIRIPLHREPTDREHVAKLVQAVMCGNRPGCQATYSERPPRDLATAIAIVDDTDPLLWARR